MQSKIVVVLTMMKQCQTIAHKSWVLLLLCLSTLLTFSLEAIADDEFNSESNLVVFVGSVTKSEEVPCRPETDENGNISPFGCFDAQMKTTFEILDVISGEYTDTSIEVTSFDHFGMFPFLNHEYALMYVAVSEGRYFQHKYQFDPVYKTKNARWAGCGAWHVDKSHHPDAAEKEPIFISFTDPPKINLSEIAAKWGKTVEEVQTDYKNDSYVIEDGIATCLKGIYAEDLFEIRNTTYLAARRKYSK